jgi:hypothetical protein
MMSSRRRRSTGWSEDLDRFLQAQVLFEADEPVEVVAKIR